MRVLIVGDFGPGLEYPCCAGDRVRGLMAERGATLEYTSVCSASDLPALAEPLRSYAAKAVATTGWSIGLAEVGTRRVLAEAANFELCVLLGRRVQTAVLWSRSSESPVYFVGTEESRYLCIPYPSGFNRWYNWASNRELVERFLDQYVGRRAT